MSTQPKSVSGIGEIHEISQKLEEEYQRKKAAQKHPPLEQRVNLIEAQIAELHNQHKNLLEYFQELAEAFVSVAADSKDE